MSKVTPFVLISAGGTGGHMSPASALASELISRGIRVELITDIRGKKFSNMFGGVQVRVVKSGTSHAVIWGKLKGAFNLGTGIIHALFLVKSLKPDLVIGFGGYPSVPGVFAAQRLNIPTILHEQNAIIGKANIFLAPNADRIALSMPYLRGLEKIDRLRAVITGNPVRAEISSLRDKPYILPADGDKMRILVMGGSLGASIFGDIVPQALASLPSNLRKNISITQQCREADIFQAKSVYEGAGIDAKIAIFFDDIAEEMGKAHLVISRSGASSVAEITATGRPAIYVPYPHHKDQQQKKNAAAVADLGGAWIIDERDFTQDALLAKLGDFLQNPDILLDVAQKAKECGKPEAAKRLGNLVSAIISSL